MSRRSRRRPTGGSAPRPASPRRSSHGGRTAGRRGGSTAWRARPTAATPGGVTRRARSATRRRRDTARHARAGPGARPPWPRKSRTSRCNWEPVIAILFFAALIFMMWRMLKVMPRIKPQRIKPSSDQSVTLRGHRGRGRREGGAAGDRRVPARPEAVPGARREGAEGDPAARAAGHGQDAAGEGGGERVGRAVLRAVGGVVRGDVRGPRRGAHPPPVRDRAQARTGDHLHRRARRGRRPARDGHLGREGPDAEPAAGGDGRLRLERAGGGDRGVEPARQARPRAAAPGSLRPPGVRRAAGRQRPPGRPAGAHARQAAGGPRPRRGGAADERADGGGPGEHLQRGGDLRDQARSEGDRDCATSTRRSSA